MEDLSICLILHQISQCPNWINLVREEISYKSKRIARCRLGKRISQKVYFSNLHAIVIRQTIREVGKLGGVTK